MTWLPLTRKQWADEREVLRRNISWLLERLYQRPSDVPKEIGDEAINWGDLSMTGLEKHGNLWIVTLEEATDGQCPTLCRYVSDWLERWGWKAKVETTW